MVIKDRSDPIICIKNILYRKDISNGEKTLLIRIMIEKYEEFEFSIKKYSRDTNLSISSIKRFLIHLDKLGILIRKNKEGGRYSYIVECSNI